MNTHALLYPSQPLEQRLRVLGFRGDLNLATIMEWLPVGTQFVRVDSFWYCIHAKTLRSDIRAVNAGAELLAFLREEEYVTF